MENFDHNPIDPQVPHVTFSPKEVEKMVEEYMRGGMTREEAEQAVANRKKVAEKKLGVWSAIKKNTLG